MFVTGELGGLRTRTLERSEDGTCCPCNSNTQLDPTSPQMALRTTPSVVTRLCSRGEEARNFAPSVRHPRGPKGIADLSLQHHRLQLHGRLFLIPNALVDAEVVWERIDVAGERDGLAKDLVQHKSCSSTVWLNQPLNSNKLIYNPPYR